MGFFDDETGFGIEDIFKKFVDQESFTEYTNIGPNGKRRVVRKSLRDSKRMPANQIITPKEIFFIFDLSGSKNVNVEIKDELTANDYGEKISTGTKLLCIFSGENDLGKYILPKKIKAKKMSYTFKNGILEVKFKK
jgi:HSP20 family molecular chaperone IbpA